jgi:hypothetical protein
MSEPDFIPLHPCQTVRRGRVVNRCRRWTVAIAVLAGAWVAFWLVRTQLPYVVIHSGESGRWERIEIDWKRTMLGERRPTSR